MSQDNIFTALGTKAADASFARVMEKQGAGRLRALGSLLRPVAAPAAAGTAGWFGAPYLADLAGVESDVGRTAHRLATAGTLAAAFSPGTSQYLFSRPQTAKKLTGIAGSGLSQADRAALAAQRVGTPLRGSLYTGSLIAAPTTIAGITDPAKRNVERLVRTIEENPDLVADPMGAAKNIATEAGMNIWEHIKPELLGEIDPALRTVGGAALGGLGGGILGSGLSHLISPDSYYTDERGRKYRRRILHRTLLPLLLGLGGWGLGAYAGAKSPQLIGKKAADLTAERTFA